MEDTMTAPIKPSEYYYSESVSIEPVRGLPRLVEVSIFAKHGKYELLAKTDSVAKAALIVRAVNTHERAMKLINKYHAVLPTPESAQFIADMEG